MARCALAVIGFLLLIALALPARAQAACDFTGTAGPDFAKIQLTGNDLVVEICTLGGNDNVKILSPTVPTENIKIVVTAGRGNDTVGAPVSFMGKLEVLGGPGNDVAQGGSGNDLLNGGLGADILRGGPGPDLLLGGRGVDRVLGQAGNDTIKTGPGKDLAKGGPGADSVDGKREQFPHIVEVCVDHVGPGESYIVVKVRGAPYADFSVYLTQTGSYENPVADRETGATGQTEVRIPISDYGTYAVRVTTHTWSGDLASFDQMTVVVTPAEDCTPHPRTGS